MSHDHAFNQPDTEQQRKQRAAAVADKGQGQSCGRQQVEVHTDGKVFNVVGSTNLADYAAQVTVEI